MLPPLGSQRRGPSSGVLIYIYIRVLQPLLALASSSTSPPIFPSAEPSTSQAPGSPRAWPRRSARTSRCPLRSGSARRRRTRWRRSTDLPRSHQARSGCPTRTSPVRWRNERPVGGSWYRVFRRCGVIHERDTLRCSWVVSRRGLSCCVRRSDVFFIWGGGKSVSLTSSDSGGSAVSHLKLQDSRRI